VTNSDAGKDTTLNEPQKVGESVHESLKTGIFDRINNTGISFKINS